MLVLFVDDIYVHVKAVQLSIEKLNKPDLRKSGKNAV